MRRLVVVTVVALGFAGSARAAAPIPDARAFFVMNAATGEVLASHNAYESMPIASITKLMTVLVALKHLKPTDVVTVSNEAAQVGESRIPLFPGERITVGDLLVGALIQSANNAADALASAASHGDLKRFVGWMNARARALGLRDTHFARADGLDAPNHVSSARDVAVLAQVAMHSPIVRDLVSRRTDAIEGGRFVAHTWNDLLGVFPGLIGVKTGHTNDAGWCQVAAARRRGYTIYVVILGSPTRARRNADLQELLAWGVSQYRTLRLVDTQTYAWAAAPFGRHAVALVTRKPLVRVVRVGRPIVEKIIAPTAVSLPVGRGQRLGRIEVWSRGKLLGSRPLLAGRSVPRPGVGGRLRWYSTRTMHNLLGLFS